MLPTFVSLEPGGGRAGRRQGQAIDLSWLVVPGTWTSSLLTGMLGLRPSPTVIEVAGYLVYAAPMLLFVLVPDRLRPRRGGARTT